MKHLNIFISIVLTLVLNISVGQEIVSAPPVKERKELKFSFNDSGSHYVKFTFLNQVWLRFNESNPGTTVNGTAKPQTWDIGLRRTRFQLFGQVTDRVFVYTQFGQNNISYASPRKQGVFFLDALTEFKVAKEYLSMGAGLTAWSGSSRYASPSIGTILSMDAPLYQQSTNDATDQFVRKLSVYAKGKIGKLDYRLALSDPMSITQSNVQSETISRNSLFSNEPSNPQLNGYFMYQFLDSESNLTPYNAGSYLGKKSIFNIGAGFVVQHNAMWHLTENQDTTRTNLMLFSVDVFYDKPLNKEKETAITTYWCFSTTDFGPNYVRNVGVMNPANGVNDSGTFNGSGDAFPMLGTGSTLYGQFGYLFQKNLLGDLGTIQPYAAFQLSNFQLLDDPMLMYEGGINWLVEGNRVKMSLNYQSRPVYKLDENNDYKSSLRKGMAVFQFQISI